jgi:NADH-quinone oxidoreductase subunit G/[NiFe] hydrogenase diaphorase moiety small subunit
MAEKIIVDNGVCRAPVSMRRSRPEIERDDAHMVRVTIDGLDTEVPFGITILEAAKRQGIKIPTLCFHEDLCIAGVCRICLVEVTGHRILHAACAYPITETIEILTNTPRVRRARRHMVDLLISEHVGECYSCWRNNNCELQSLAWEYGVRDYKFGHVNQPRTEIDRSAYSVTREMDKCVLCRRCIRTCIDLQEVGVLEALHRGADTKIGTFMEKQLGSVVCINCGQCINRCPTGALRARDPGDDVWNAIDDPTKHVVIQTAPSPRAGMGECFGLEPGTPVTKQLNTALKRCGFDRVFDTNFTADLTIMEEGTELILRLYKALVQKDQTVALPQFTSCSPGWVKYLEHFYPQYIPNLSSAKSPQQMFGTLIKTFYAERTGVDPKDIVSVALMPCTAKKYECNRPEMCDSGYKDVDYGMTTRELARMIHQAGIDLPAMPDTEFDDPFGTETGSGVIFGATGGVMEAALRSVIELVTGKVVEDFYAHADIVPIRGFDGIRMAEIPITEVGPVPEIIAHLVPNWDWLLGAKLKVGVAHGTANAKKVLEDIKAGGPFSECHFIEFMACPGGCLGGGGQPIPTSPEIRAKRAEAIYAEDRDSTVRKSHENPAVTRIYEEFLTDGPCGEKSHHLLHTAYVPRGKYIP